MGGKAFTDISPVEKNEITPIIDWLLESLGGFEYKTLGSTGKKETSGDIDLAIPSTRKPYDAFVGDLEMLLGNSNVNTNGYQFNQIYTRIPCGDKFIQVDFMLGDIRLLEFTHWAPDSGTSMYSGTHRTEYLKSVAKAISDVYQFNDSVIARTGYTLHHDKGLEYSARWRKPRVDGKGYVHKMTRVLENDLPHFIESFPLLPYAGYSIISKPNQICEVLFGKGTTEQMVNSYEQITKLVSSNKKLHDNSDLIWALYSDRLIDIKQKLPERLV